MTSRHSVNSSANSDAPATKIRRTEAQTEASNSTASTSAAISRRDGGASTDATSSKASNAKADQKAVKSDSLADNLTCIICQSVFHDCVSVQPCLHSFCAGCLSEWLGKSDSCPVCRKTVELVSTNHTLSGCVASLVAQRPELGRTSSDIRELDAKNKIPKSSVLKFDRDARRKFAGDYADGEDDNDDDGDGEDEDDEDEEDDEDNGAGDNAAPQLYAAGFNIRCRQCPGNSLRLSNEDVSSGAPPADSDVQIYVVDVRNPSGFSDQPLAAASNSAAISGAACSSYICSAEQVHVLCECCREAMPSRARPGIPTWLVPPQRCAVCERVYCHAYWKCKRRASPCYGCLAPLRNWRVTEAYTRVYLLGNSHESGLLNRYLARKSMNVGDMLRCCVGHLDSGSWRLAGQVFSDVPADVGTRQVLGETPLCRRCALATLGNLVLQFRQSLTTDERNVHFNETRRSLCWYGTECRTQTHNDAHAQSYNHVCPRSKFN